MVWVEDNCSAKQLPITSVVQKGPSSLEGELEHPVMTKLSENTPMLEKSVIETTVENK